jgi:hypothetical protein
MSDERSRKRGSLGLEWNDSGGCPGARPECYRFAKALEGELAFEHGDPPLPPASLEDFQPDAEGRVLVNTVDIVFVASHGGYLGATLHATPGNSTGNVGATARLGGRLKWLVIDACSVLEDRSGLQLGYWSRIFHGLRYMLAFDSYALDEVARGQYFAEYLNEGLPVREAWRRACQETEPALHGLGSATFGGRWAYLRAIGREGDSLDDRWSELAGDQFPLTGVRELVYVSGGC